MTAPEISFWNATLLDINSNPVNLKGIITDLSAPTLERDFDTDRRAGEIGVIARPKFFNEVKVSFTYKRWFPAFSKAILEAINLPISLQASAIIQSTGGITDVYTWSVRGYPSSVPLGDLSSDGMDGEIEMMCHYLSMTYGAFTLIYDPANFNYSVNGTNLFATFKTNLGL